MRTKSFIAIAVLPLLLFGCAYNKTMASSSVLGAKSGSLTDPEIAAIVTNANQGEIDQANAVVNRLSSPDVKAFAQMMINDHTAALGSARDLFTHRNITAMENATSRQLAVGSQQLISNLSNASGMALDHAYMQAQIDEHQWLLNALDTSLIPSAQTSDVKALLRTQRTAVAAHLDRAKQVMGSMMH